MSIKDPKCEGMQGFGSGIWGLGWVFTRWSSSRCAEQQHRLCFASSHRTHDDIEIHAKQLRGLQPNTMTSMLEAVVTMQLGALTCTNPSARPAVGKA